METENTKAIVLTCYYRPKPGGLCKRLFRAIEALLERGHDVHYLAVERFPIDHPQCHFHRFPWPAFMTGNLAFWGMFYCFAPLILLYLGIRHRSTHSFAFSPTYSMFLQPVRWIKNIPLTLFLRGDILEGHRSKARFHWLIGLERYIEGLGIAGVRLYGVTDTLRNKVTNRHPFMKPLHVGVLRNDISTHTVIQRPKKLNDIYRLGSVGVLDEGKNLSLLLQCVRTLKNRRFHLCIYGTGPAEKSLKTMVQSLDISDKVSFMGWVGIPAQIWNNIDVLLFPSLHEGAPNAVLEAIGHGVPVLASDIPEHREILPGSNLVAVDSADAWVGAIGKLLSKPESTIQHLLHEQASYTQTLRFDWNNRVTELILNRAVENQ